MIREFLICYGLMLIVILAYAVPVLAAFGFDPWHLVLEAMQ